MFQNKDEITFKVGDSLFTAAKSSLLEHPNTLFTRLLEGDVPDTVVQKDQGRAFELDRNEQAFSIILEYLKTGEMPASTLSNATKELIRREAAFYGVSELEGWAETELARKDERLSLSEIKIIENEAINASGVDCLGRYYARCYNFDQADLSGRDLRGIFSDHRTLVSAWGSNLQGADLRNAGLLNANLAGADLRGANLQGAYLNNADLEGARWKGRTCCGAVL
ncbi:unnamed protein product, partial [Heterosigma akashiwo]